MEEERRGEGGREKGGREGREGRERRKTRREGGSGSPPPSLISPTRSHSDVVVSIHSARVGFLISKLGGDGDKFGDFFVWIVSICPA